MSANGAGRPDARPMRMSGAEFALCCGALHFALAALAILVALAGADSGGQLAGFVFVGYFAAFTAWVAARAWLFVRYLGERPRRGGPSAALHLAGGLAVLLVGVLGGPLLPVALAVASFVIPAAATWWTIQPFNPPPWSESAGAGKGVLWAVVAVTVLVVSAVLLLALIVHLLPGA